MRFLGKSWDTDEKENEVFAHMNLDGEDAWVGDNHK